ncbi:response regulator transcription factor [Dermatophilus congolensis]|uniref:response regulator transcription factor n=1 Tax=Dermatophilus congolensis TaxID=1863 RepID=UPI001AAFE92D|nr:response regulator transcription factor [Dermatophilus congolensis]MBO3142021.1 response regulator transcription factor [Dermatophilus congolensis]MBO3151012.1 response regulator transcription factor [Dermatophilus congolensis]MBO3161983.1 response regulator transcription factor [Dermatophilus congolensis]MBO3162296.1 response regulator transcription factor [Dermatophilus congolensis]MBO3175850.1 response regulator transcription factor [Dermatophilus congolensis]
MSEPIRVAVVDDQPLLVSAFSALIDNQPDMHIVGTATDGAAAVTLLETTTVDVVLMDIRMPHLDGVEATRRILAHATEHVNVLILTTFNIDELVLAAISAGARGFLLKDAEPTEVLDAIRAVHRGEAVIATQATPALLAALHTPTNSPITPSNNERHTAIAALTPREIDVLRLIAHTTVKTHVGNLLLKLNARDRVALVILAHSVGLSGSPGTVPIR